MALDNIILNLKVKPDSKTIKEAQALIKGLREELSKLDKGTLQYIKTLNKLNRVLRSVNASLTTTDKKLKSAGDSANTFASKMGKANSKVQKSTKNSTKAVSSFGGSLSSINPIAGAASLAVTALAGAVVQGATKYAEFQAQVALTGGLLQATAAETKQLEQSALELGSTTAFTAAQVANLQEELAKRGFTVDEIVGSTEQVLGLAQAFKLDLGKAAGIASGTIRAFGLDVSETGRVVDVVGKLAGSSGAGVLDFGEAISSIGAVAQLNNISLETQATLYGKLADSQIKGTKAGTVIKNLQGELFNETGKLAKATGLYAKSQDDIIPILQKLKKENLSFTQIQQIFGKVSAAGIGILIKQADTLEGLKTQLQDAGGFTDALAKKQKQTLAGSFTAASSALDGLLIRGFKPFEEATISIVNTFTDLISKTTEYISENDTLVDVVETLVDIIQGLVPVFGEILDFIQPLLSSIGNLALKVFGFIKSLIDFGKVVRRVIKENAALNTTFELLTVPLESLVTIIDTVSSAFSFFNDVLQENTAELRNNQEAIEAVVTDSEKINENVSREIGNRKGVTKELSEQIGNNVERLLQEKEFKALVGEELKAQDLLNKNGENKKLTAKELEDRARKAVILSNNLTAIERARLLVNEELASSIEIQGKELKSQGKSVEEIAKISQDRIDAALLEKETTKEQIKLEEENAKIQAENDKKRKDSQDKIDKAKAKALKAAKDGLSEINTLRDLELIKLKELLAKGEISRREFELKSIKLSAETSQKRVSFIENELSESLQADKQFVVEKAKSNLKALESTKQFYDKTQEFRDEDLQSEKDKRAEEVQVVKDSFNEIQAASDRATIQRNLQQELELARLKVLLSEGTISREEFEDSSTQISIEGAKERIKIAEAEFLALQKNSEELKKALQASFEAGDINQDELTKGLKDIQDTLFEEGVGLELKLAKLKELLNKKELDDDKKKLEKRKQFFEASVKSAQDVIGVFDKLNNQQLTALNQRLDNQKTKVQQAIQLAELGNTAILEEELKRQRILEEEQRKAQERAKKFAAVQQALNSAVALSNSIVAITKTAAESGIASPATIPLVIAAIGAGIGVVGSLVGGFFKDGVIDFNGKGTGTSDSNLVAISNGESVITANGTRKAPEALKLINEGKLSDKDLSPAYGFNNGEVASQPVIINRVDNSELVNRLDSQSRLLNAIVSEVQMFEKKFNFTSKGLTEYISTKEGRINKLNKRI